MALTDFAEGRGGKGGGERAAVALGWRGCGRSRVGGEVGVWVSTLYEAEAWVGEILPFNDSSSLRLFAETLAASV